MIPVFGAWPHPCKEITSDSSLVTLDPNEPFF
ncbi:hypothetical protein N806_32000 [Rhodococcus sp. P27]|nr:hypothetical protein N806_17150 [Rhodococcus sp. P27]ERB55738.1 hypothetical protein N806_32000 [Rhodococcus sp. P27]